MQRSKSRLDDFKAKLRIKLSKHFLMQLHGRHYLKTVRIVYFITRPGRSNQRELHAFLFNISCVLRLWDNLYLAALSVGLIAPEL